MDNNTVGIILHKKNLKIFNAQEKLPIPGLFGIRSDRQWRQSIIIIITWFAKGIPGSWIVIEAGIGGFLGGKYKKTSFTLRGT